MKLLSAISLILWSCLVYSVQQSCAQNHQPSTPENTSAPTPESNLTTSGRPAQKASSDAARSLPDHQVPRSAEVDTLMTQIAAMADRIRSLERKLDDKRCEYGRVITVVGMWGTPTLTFKKRRRYRKRITFIAPFSTTPTVLNAIGALVSYQGGTMDVGSFVRNVGRSGFDLNVEDSTDSIVHYVFTSWMACS